MSFAKAMVSQAVKPKGSLQKNFSNHTYDTQVLTNTLCGSKKGEAWLADLGGL